MPFKSDEQRKAIFANLFNRRSKRSKVSSSNVINFEVKSTKMKTSSHKPLKFKYEQIRLKDIKTKEERIFCNMCKRGDLNLEKGKCKECETESKSFKQPREPIFFFSPNEMVDLIMDLDSLSNSVSELREDFPDIAEEEWNDLEMISQDLAERIGNFAESGDVFKVRDYMMMTSRVWRRFNNRHSLSFQIGVDQLFANSNHNIADKIRVMTSG